MAVLVVAGIASLALFTNVPQEPAGDARLSGVLSAQPKGLKDSIAN